MNTASETRRHPVRWVLLLSLLPGLSLVAPSPSATAVGVDLVGPMSSSQCASGTFCLWSSALYAGSFWSTSSQSLVNVGGVTGARSLWNRTGFAVRVYSAAGGGGSSSCFAPGTQKSQVALASFSVKVLTTTAC
ncbi:peptidase inhibitor family I36 protein [Pengzhenrongella frigida]|uniref:Peptidase inhibitor family I36 protein n=1 Tax=Pengzhenrongella frigida TaxID=1259133 RepID=A0A4Q5N489_9MICO|nr:peptidase inhibitor family I36 protein [Cellulomonas sp. HLT2-17]RYV52995.1 hypothetical protein EUA98_00435 [Cellulomonas sp. HLT2-17]